jgi:polar amino acid transport system ATP-binding protein
MRQSEGRSLYDDAVVRAERVCKRYGTVRTLVDIDLTVHRGETVAIIGPSGSGKTTLLRCINFLTAYDSGRLYVEGQLVGYHEQNGALVKSSEREINNLRKHIGMVFQKYALFPHRTALENLLEGPLYVLKLPRDVAVQRGIEALAAVGLSDKADAYPSQLSGGQQQRVGIARALVMQPKLMLFDEVTSALDPELVGEVLTVMNRLASQKMTMLVVTHEMQFARDGADRIVFMDGGRIAADMPSKEFFVSPPSGRIESFLRRSLER